MRCLALLLCAFILGCSADDVGTHEQWSTADVTTPGATWPEATPEAVGLDPARLADVDDFGRANDGRCFLVVKHGRLVHEAYFGDGSATQRPQTWSIAKSYFSALIGAAIQHRFIPSVDMPVHYLLWDWDDDARREVTIADLLSMVGGVGIAPVDDAIWAATTLHQTDSALETELHAPPRSEWTYTNRGVQVLEALLEQATGMPTHEFAKLYLLAPIGAPDAHFESDWDDKPQVYANLRATCREHARFGYLMLHGGQWGAQQLLDPDYVERSLTPSQSMNKAYGLLWWLNGETPHINSSNEPMPTMMFPGAPSDLVSAKGVGNSFIDVIPSEDTVIVFARVAAAEAIFSDWPWKTYEAIRSTSLNLEHTEVLRRYYGQ